MLYPYTGEWTARNVKKFIMMRDVEWIAAEQRLTGTVSVSMHGGVLTQVANWRGQRVLVKTLLTTDPDSAARFAHEGQVAAALRHPLIVPLLAQSPTQLFFPFVPGGPLRERLDAGRLTVREAVSILRGILRALVNMHAQGVVHQDLKPENIVLAGGKTRCGAVRIIDFGMSHARHLPLDIHSGTRMGTPHYMAPEQFQGVRGDPRSDLYSAGVILFEALAGHPPYEDALGWLVGTRKERAELPGPPELHPLMLGAMSRDPAGRPASAQAMLDELALACVRLGLPTLTARPMPLPLAP